MPSLEATGVLEIETAPVFQDFLQPARYKAAWGGRGSGKSHFFAELAVENCMMDADWKLVCIREIQKSLEQSVKELIEAKIKKFKVEHYFRMRKTHTERVGGDGIIIYQGMQNHTAQSIKSLEGYDCAWAEEAQSISKNSLTILRPTIRKPNSELWFSWNPDQPTDAVDLFFRGPTPPPEAIIKRVNWTDNPWFPEVLDQDRRFDYETNPAMYEHVWEGGYKVNTENALWNVEMLDACRWRRELPKFARVVVAIDPAVSDHEGSAETGIIVAARDFRGNAFVLEDGSGKYSPSEWAKQAIRLFHAYEGDRFVAEGNQGGNLVSHCIQTQWGGAPVKIVKASRGKIARAEPVAALYEQGRVYHVTTFSKLESQMLYWEPLSGQPSPDRLDALVWAITELLVDGTTYDATMDWV